MHAFGGNQTLASVHFEANLGHSPLQVFSDNIVSVERAGNNLPQSG